MLIVALVWFSGICVACKLSINWLEASTLGFLSVLLTYKVGHPQFFIPWLFLVAALPLVKTESAHRLAWICIPFVLFLSIFLWGYAYGTDQYEHVLGWVRRNVGLFACFQGICIILAYFRFRKGQVSVKDTS